jgi:bifunctional DNA-binding transcriptional regulator/antitoxin component of YhaV-PrlF toxin-antitoxin module
MPQIARGGKHVFGWSLVMDTGRILIPPMALKEYRLKESEKLFVIPGSRTSGGFGLGSQASLKKSPLKRRVDMLPGLKKFQVPEGGVIEFLGKPYCWVGLRDGGVTIPEATLKMYGISIGDALLVIRGSGLAIGFALRGPIVKEAKRHSELEVFGSSEFTSRRKRPISSLSRHSRSI